MTLGVAHPRGMQGHSIRVSTRREHARRPNEASTPPLPLKKYDPGCDPSCNINSGLGACPESFFSREGGASR
jgi:hypothetical protein